MNTVVLVIWFFSSAAGSDQMAWLDVGDMAVCERIAAHWLSQQEGSIRVKSATCEVKPAIKIG